MTPHEIISDIVQPIDPYNRCADFRFVLYNHNVQASLAFEEYVVYGRTDLILFNAVRQLVYEQIKFPPIGEYDPHGKAS